MISVIVTYKVKADYAEENKQHIARFLNDFENLNTAEFQYTVYTKDDGVTFVHHSMYANEAVQQAVLNVPSFLEFQRLRDESGLDGTHKVDVLSFVGSTSRDL